MGIISRLRNAFSGNLNDQSVQLDDVLLKALLNCETITREKAMTLPAVSGAVDFITGTIASMPIRLFKYKQGKVSEITNDARTRILNGDTGDTLNAFQMKKALVADYLLGDGGYAVIRRNFNDVTGMFYVDPAYISAYKNADPVYKYTQFQIGAKRYEAYEIFKLLRNSKDGATGTGVVSEIAKALETAYQTLIYQLGMVKTGGNKRGFLSANRRLGADEIKTLKTAWANLYANNESNVVVLNNGIDFKEASSTAVESQLNESKLTLRDEIKSVFHIYDDFNRTFKEAIYPILKAFEAELNNVLLLENEKKNMYFSFDVKEIIKASIKERYEAHEIALRSGWASINEVRKDENMNDIEGMDVLNLGLGAVLYDINEGTYYTPNTGEVKSSDDDTGEETTEEENPEEETEDNQKEGGEEGSEVLQEPNRE